MFKCSRRMHEEIEDSNVRMLEEIVDSNVRVLEEIVNSNRSSARGDC